MLEDGIKKVFVTDRCKTENKNKTVSEHNTLEIQRKYLIQLFVRY